MSYNPEKPQFWQPFNISKIPTRSFRGLRRLDTEHSRRHKSIFEISPEFPGMIVYPEFSESQPLHEILGFSGFAVTNHLKSLRIANPDLIETISIDGEGQPTSEPRDYIHGFVWRDGGAVMTDIWRSELDEVDYPTSYIRVFRDMDEVDANQNGHAGGNTLIVMGREEEYRRKLAKLSKRLNDFLVRNVRNMPEFEPGFIAHARLQRR